jgi:hypothetical protein
MANLRAFIQSYTLNGQLKSEVSRLGSGSMATEINTWTHSVRTHMTKDGQVTVSIRDKNGNLIDTLWFDPAKPEVK